MKLCSLCHWLLQKRRWLLLPAGMALALLLCLLLPRWLGMALVALVTLLTAMLLVYVRDLGQLRTSRHLRMPSPRDAQCEIVMMDASLVDTGVALQAAAQPLNACPELSMRMGSGALLLGTAMVFLADELPGADGPALLQAVAKMNLRAQTIRSRSPVLLKGTENGMRCITVQDGAQERSYFMADAETVAAGCGSIWEDRVRPMGQNDRARVLDAAKYMAAGGCRVLAFATATDDERPIFLGLAALGDGLDLQAVREIQELRAMGLTLILRDGEAVPLDIAALRRNLDIPDLHARPDVCLSAGTPYPDSRCLTILMQDESSLDAPIRRLRDHFACMAHMLRRLAHLLGACLICCCIAGGYWALPLCTALLTAAYLSYGSLVSCRNLHWPGLLLSALGSLLVRLLLNAAVPGCANAAGTTMCIVLTAVIALLLRPYGKQPSWQRLMPLLAACGIALLIVLLTSLPALPAALLPMAFGGVCGGLTGLIAILIDR